MTRKLTDEERKVSDEKSKEYQKEYQAKYNVRPERMARAKAKRDLPENKAKRKEYGAKYHANKQKSFE